MLLLEDYCCVGGDMCVIELYVWLVGGFMLVDGIEWLKVVLF